LLMVVGYVTIVAKRLKCSNKDCKYITTPGIDKLPSNKLSANVSEKI
jgi:hypothetical protein